MLDGADAPQAQPVADIVQCGHGDCRGGAETGSSDGFVLLAASDAEPMNELDFRGISFESQRPLTVW